MIHDPKEKTPNQLLKGRGKLNSELLRVETVNRTEL